MLLRILIVEDEPLIALHLETIVQEMGHSVVAVVSDMHAALAAAARTPVDVAIVDIVLARRTDGIHTARRLRECHGTRSLYVSVHRRRREEALHAAWHPLGFIDKPFVDDDIVRALRKAC